jgi:hypothetical protein
MEYNTLLAGCSFTDPVWQHEVPWSVEYAKIHPSYIVAKAGFGIKGITTEALYFLESHKEIDKMVLILPDIWRLDIEVDSETYLCNCMVDTLTANSNGWEIKDKARRKWIISGGPLSYKHNNKEIVSIFDQMYKHQGWLVIFKEQMMSLERLLTYCKHNNIDYYISAIRDPMEQFDGLEYIQPHLHDLLINKGEYNNWFTFNSKFINLFVGHDKHPNTKQHIAIANYILEDVIK